MNIQFHKDLESGDFNQHDIYYNGRNIGNIVLWGDQWNVRLDIGKKSWSAVMHKTLEDAKEFVRKTISEEVNNSE